MSKKVHEVISFRQEAWLKSYIEMNTALRTQAKNDFEKDYFQLKNNSAYGKTMENIRKHRDIYLEVYLHLNQIIILPSIYLKNY